jgi:hypothetical protein
MQSENRRQIMMRVRSRISAAQLRPERGEKAFLAGSTSEPRMGKELSFSKLLDGTGA